MLLSKNVMFVCPFCVQKYTKMNLILIASLSYSCVFEPHLLLCVTKCDMHTGKTGLLKAFF